MVIFVGVGVVLVVVVRVDVGVVKVVVVGLEVGVVMVVVVRVDDVGGGLGVLVEVCTVGKVGVLLGVTTAVLLVETVPVVTFLGVGVVLVVAEVVRVEEVVAGVLDVVVGRVGVAGGVRVTVDWVTVPGVVSGVKVLPDGVVTRVLDTVDLGVLMKGVDILIGVVLGVTVPFCYLKKTKQSGCTIIQSFIMNTH